MVGLARMKEIVEVLRPELRAFCDENNDELLDLSELPRPCRCTAPVRFMPDYANLNLSRADDRREISNEHRKKLFLSAARIRRTFSW